MRFLKGKIAILGFLLLTGSAFVTAQESGENAEKYIERILEASDDEFDYTQLVERLTRYYKKPLALNEADREDLLSMQVLTVPQVNDILAYRQQYGDFQTLYELNAVPSLDKETIELILPFVTTRSSEASANITPENLWKYGDHGLILRHQQTLEPRKGRIIADTASSSETNKGFLGSPADLYARYTYEYFDRVSMGFTAEKDAGEPFFKRPNQSGFDFYSGHLYLSDIGSLKSLSIGDFNAQFGQGVVLWSGFGFNKTASVLSISKNERGLAPYRSSNEFNFLRGAGVTWEFGDTEMTGFYSRKQNDATVRKDTSGDPFFSAFRNNGYHRTQNEMESRDRVQETLFGGHVDHSIGQLDVGATLLGAQYGMPIKARDRAYAEFDYNGTQPLNAGIDYEWLYEGFYFFGETGYSKNGAIANLHGMLTSVGSGFQVGMLYRNYPENYQAQYANAFRESGQVQNEEGFYLGITGELMEHWNIKAYFDQFRFPWLRFRSDKPSSGYEYLGELAWEKGPVEMYWRLKGQNKTRNMPDQETAFNEPVLAKKWQIRWNMDYEMNKHWSFQTRVQHARFRFGEGPVEKGLLGFQDIRYQTRNNDVYVIGRYALFDVSDYNARIFAYENDLLYSFSIPFFQDRGMRYYILTRADLSDHLSCWFKVGRTCYFNRETVGSGLRAIAGSTETTVKAQIRLQF